MILNPTYDLATVETVIRLLSTRHMPQEGIFWENALKWVTHFPGHIDQGRKRLLINKIQWCFDIKEEEIYATISGLKLPPPAPERLLGSEADFDSHITTAGWPGS